MVNTITRISRERDLKERKTMQGVAEKCAAPPTPKNPPYYK